MINQAVQISVQQFCHRHQPGNVSCSSLENINQYDQSATKISKSKEHYCVCAVEEVFGTYQDTGRQSFITLLIDGLNLGIYQAVNRLVSS